MNVISSIACGIYLAWGMNAPTWIEQAFWFGKGFTGASHAHHISVSGGEYATNGRVLMFFPTDAAD